MRSAATAIHDDEEGILSAAVGLEVEVQSLFGWVNPEFPMVSEIVMELLIPDIPSPVATENISLPNA